MKSGGEAGRAHSQQQEDGEGVRHFVRIHSFQLTALPLLLLSLPPSVPFCFPPLLSACSLAPSLLSSLPPLPVTFCLASMRRNALSVSEKTLGGKLEEVQLGRSSAEADLAIEKQWRASLQVGRCAHVSEYMLVSEYGSNGICTSLRRMWGSGECVCTMY